jgi:hypothetical protein
MLITVHVLLQSGALERFDDLLRGFDAPVSLTAGDEAQVESAEAKLEVGPGG